MFFSKKPKRIFLDFASTTPTDLRVLKEMEKYHSLVFANPSALYSEALTAKDAVNKSREKIGTILNCRKEEIVFTSGGTESNNLALLGIFEAHKTSEFIPHFITTVSEHPAILEVLQEVEKRGGEVTYLNVDEDGLVSLKDLANSIKSNTVLVTVIYGNNEIGTIQPVKEIGRVIKDWRTKNHTSLPYFHTDACQAGLYLPLDVLKLGVDLLTLDGIKMYGPKGAGLLYVKNGVKILPVNFGGGQEKGLRSGTENVPAIVGLAKAIEIADSMRESGSARLSQIRDYAIESILKIFPNSKLNGSHEFRLPNNVNICFKGLDAEFAVISLDVLGISASYSSSCRTLKDDSSSYVVENLGRKDCALSSLRFTLGRTSTKSDIDTLVSCLKKVIK